MCRVSQEGHDGTHLAHLPALHRVKRQKDPVLGEAQLGGEEVCEAGAVITVLLCCAHHRDG